LREAGLAGGAAEHAARLAGAVSAGHGQVSGPSLALLGAAGLQAAEAGQVVHRAAPPVRSSRLYGTCDIPLGYSNGARGCKRIRPQGRSVDTPEIDEEPYPPYVDDVKPFYFH